MSYKWFGGGAGWAPYDTSVFGAFPFHGGLLSKGTFTRGPVSFYMIEGGSILAIAGGLLSYVHGDTLMGNGGLLVGIAGLITAATPIIQGWIVSMREERKQKLDRLEIPNKIRENEIALVMMKEELAELQKSLTFKRELIEQQQRTISVLVSRVGSIEVVAAKAAETVSAVSARVDEAEVVLGATALGKAGKNEQLADEQRDAIPGTGCGS